MRALMCLAPLLAPLAARAQVPPLQEITPDALFIGSSTPTTHGGQSDHACRGGTRWRDIPTVARGCLPATMKCRALPGDSFVCSETDQ